MHIEKEECRRLRNTVHCWLSVLALIRSPISVRTGVTALTGVPEGHSNEKPEITKGLLQGKWNKQHTHKHTLGRMCNTGYMGRFTNSNRFCTLLKMLVGVDRRTVIICHEKMVIKEEINLVRV